MRQAILVVSTLAALAITPTARGAYVVLGNAADRNTFLGLLNNHSNGGTWALDAMNQLVFTPNANPINFFASRLNTFNTTANRTVEVGLNQGGVLVGAFLGNGIQRLDLADIMAFTVNAAAQVQPLLDTQASVLMHELGELFLDGPLGSFPNSHLFGGIQEQNNQLTALGIRGMRLNQDQFRLIGAPMGNVQQYEIRLRFQTTQAVPAAGGQPMLPAGATYFEVIRGRIIGGNFGVTNIRPGIVDLGVAYDDTDNNIIIDEVFAIVPEPASALLTLLGVSGVWAARWRLRRRGAGAGESGSAW
ncbi:PEP-CTERM sorting domain-containing protein [Tautonia sociabilis]|uniref:PEP-CTERM sorting domain-containing protein n=1 Tax=Tautonia sociabilis TaxID=2080755 RepID=A0A432MPI8_9BACT|nr:PEP-CTERM sorting domain-containing protein [Tautonia sociabilis]RUL89179.1 PEP-CTERM sorting domain-containing protein [Tautonia sociabilis]